ncbi:MAG: type II toxin-antitoxin system RelE family toxin [Promethearchaeota archaeon]
MPVNIDYKKSVYRDLKKIGIHESTRVMDRLEKVLSENPDKGEPLKGNYKGMFKLRVGDYRIVYTKTKNGILILRIRHRKHVYR